jgi:hypothetical protein
MDVPQPVLGCACTCVLHLYLHRGMSPGVTAWSRTCQQAWWWQQHWPQSQVGRVVHWLDIIITLTSYILLQAESMS